MGNLCNRVNEVMDKIYDNNSPGNATALEEELAKKKQEEEAAKQDLRERIAKDARPLPTYGELPRQL